MGLSAAAGAAESGPGPAAALVLLLLIAGVAVRWLRGAPAPESGSIGAGSRAGVVLALVTGAGFAGGLEAGTESLAGCSARLEGGTPVMVLGSIGTRIPGHPEPDATPRASAELTGVILVAAGRACRMREARVTIRRGREPRDVGAIIVAKGVWRRSGEGRLPRDPGRYGYISIASDEVVAGAGATSAGRRLRAGLARRLDRRLRTEEMAGIAKALLLADRSTLDREIRQRFIDAGIVHLLAISGLHIGMIAGGVSWLLGLAVRDRRRWVWAGLTVSGYVALIGWPPAATRAALIFWGHAYCRWRDRPTSVWNLAGAAAIVALGVDPLLATDPGFQLSYAGFVGVIAGHRLGGHWLERLASVRAAGTGGSRRLPSWMTGLASGLAASTGAFVLTAPIAAIHFGRIVATSIPASVASTGLVGLAIPAVSATALLPGAAGDLAGEAATDLLRLLLRIAGLFAGVPLDWTVRPATGWIWTACGALAVAAIASRRRTRWRYVLAIAAVVSASIGRPAIRRVAGAGTPLVCTLDVGQGDAAVVRTGAGRWLVFDAGPGTSVLDGRALPGADLRFASWMGDAGRDVIAPFLRSRGAREIEIFALSHPHLDHFGGVGTLFDAFRIRNVLDPGVVQPSAAYLGLLERVDEERAMWVRAAAGDVVTLDDLTLHILWPPAGVGSDANETSLSFRLEFPGFSYVNTGDAPVETEHAILESSRPGELRSDLLKLGHHGSRTSSAVAWLRAIRPGIAVMSLGRDNRYGHPHAVTLARLDSAGVRRVWRTDREGSLCIEVAAGGWRVVRP